MTSTPPQSAAETGAPTERRTPLCLRAFSWGLWYWSTLFAIGMVATLLSLLLTEGGGPVTLFGYLAGAAFDLQFDDISDAKVVGTIILISFVGLVLGTTVIGALAAARNTGGWKPAAILLAVLGTSHVTFLSVVAVEEDKWLAAPAILFVLILALGLLVYLAAVVHCWRASRRGPAIQTAALRPGHPAAWGIGTTIGIQVLWGLAVAGMLLGGHESLQASRCQVNLREIIRGIRGYEEDNKGRLPDSLEDLCPKHLPRVPHCPKHAADRGYVYLCDYLRSPQVVGEVAEDIREVDRTRILQEALGERSTPGMPQAEQRKAIVSHLGRGRLSPRMFTFDRYGMARTPVAWETGPGHGRRRWVNVIYLDGHTAAMAPAHLEDELRTFREENRDRIRSLLLSGQPRPERR